MVLMRSLLLILKHQMLNLAHSSFESPQAAGFVSTLLLPSCHFVIAVSPTRNSFANKALRRYSICTTAASRGLQARSTRLHSDFGTGRECRKQGVVRTSASLTVRSTFGKWISQVFCFCGQHNIFRQSFIYDLKKQQQNNNKHKKQEFFKYSRRTEKEYFFFFKPKTVQLKEGCVPMQGIVKGKQAIQLFHLAHWIPYHIGSFQVQ